MKNAPQPYAGLYEEYRFDEPWDGPHNRALSPRIADFYRRQGLGPDAQDTTSFLAVTGPRTAYPGAAGRPRREFVDDPATTIIAVEVADSKIPWMQPRDLAFDGMSFALNDPSGRGPGSVFGGARVLFADGHVHELADGFDPVMLRAMLTIDGRETIHVEGDRWVLKGGGGR